MGHGDLSSVIGVRGIWWMQRTEHELHLEMVSRKTGTMNFMRNQAISGFMCIGYSPHFLNNFIYNMHV